MSFHFRERPPILSDPKFWEGFVDGGMRGFIVGLPLFSLILAWTCSVGMAEFFAVLWVITIAIYVRFRERKRS